MNETLTVFEAQVRGEVDMQVATAKAYPRHVEKFKASALALATASDTIAASMMYALPRGTGKDRKVIEGPSVRFAEILVAEFGNCRVASRVLDADEKYVTAQAVFIDLEKNVARSVEVKRRITDSRGNRYNDDMVMVTANAAASIASREAALKGVPEAVWWPVYEAARAKAVGKGGTDKTFETKRTELIAGLTKLGAVIERVLAQQKVEKVEDLTAEHCMELEALRQAIRDGGTTVNECFPTTDAEPQAEAKPGLAGLKEKLA